MCQRSLPLDLAERAWTTRSCSRRTMRDSRIVIAWLSLPPLLDRATSAPRSISSRHSGGTEMSGRRRSAGTPLLTASRTRCSSAMLVVMAVDSPAVARGTVSRSPGFARGRPSASSRRRGWPAGGRIARGRLEAGCGRLGEQGRWPGGTGKRVNCWRDRRTCRSVRSVKTGRESRGSARATRQEALRATRRSG